MNYIKLIISGQSLTTKDRVRLHYADMLIEKRLEMATNLILYVKPDIQIPRNYLLKLWPTAKTLAEYIRRARPDLDPQATQQFQMQAAQQFQTTAAQQFQMQAAQQFQTPASTTHGYLDSLLGNYEYGYNMPSTSGGTSDDSTSSTYDYMTPWSPLE